MASTKKLLFNEIDLIKNARQTFVQAAKMPRTAVIPVVRDRQMGFLNAAPYSGGVISIDPLMVFFGVKSWDSKLTYRDAEELVIAIPNRDQIDHMWVMACSVPLGINEIDLAGWTELPSKEIDTPGIAECPLNLECKKAHFIQLQQPMRAIVVAEVVGISIDTSLLKLKRSEVIRQLPMHEATSNPYTGLYGPSVLSEELLPRLDAKPTDSKRREQERKTHLSRSDFYQTKNQGILMNSIWPRPSYVVVFRDEQNDAWGIPVSGGLLMNPRPSIQIPLPKGSSAYRNIKRTGEFVISIPVRSQIGWYERLEADHDRPLASAECTLLEPNQIETPGIRECRVNIDCKLFLLEDIPGEDYALLVGKKVGLSISEEILQINHMMELYSQYLYAVMGEGMLRYWGFHDVENLSVRPLPSWGSQYHGGWWTGPEQYQAGMQFWLLELVQSGYLFEEEYFKLRRWVSWWRNEGFPVQEPLRTELKERLTTVLKMMVWAHRDYDRWHDIHSYFAEFSFEGRWESP